MLLNIPTCLNGLELSTLGLLGGKFNNSIRLCLKQDTTHNYWVFISPPAHQEMSICSLLAALLYGAETWTVYSVQTDRLQVYVMRHLRSIMGISWRDKIHEC